MRVGFFSPLPPSRTGVADYGAALLRALRGFGCIDLARDGDVNLYHLGNNQTHRAIYQTALARPGVAVLHDAVLQHFFLGALGEAAYVEEFVYNYGAWSRPQAEQLWRARASSGADPRYYQYPMVRRIAERSRAVVVHNPAAAEIVRRHAPAASVVEIPHLWEPPPLPPAAESLRLRARLGVPPGSFLFAVFGYLRESKRLMSVLRAFEAVKRERPDAFLLISGEFVSSDLERSAAALLGKPGILRRGYAPEPDFWALASAVDACINLRYPAAGETSGITLRLMGAAKPVFVTAGLETARFPETACVRIDPGPAEEAMLAHYMMYFTEFPQAARAIGREGAGYVGAFHTLERAAALYWETLCAHRG